MNWVYAVACTVVTGGWTAYCARLLSRSIVDEVGTVASILERVIESDPVADLVRQGLARSQ